MCPPEAGWLVDGERCPEEMHKRHGGAIGHTGVRLATAVWSETAPASGGGEAAVALPSRLGFQRGGRNARKQMVVEASLGPRGGVE
jgi:hypothetical protein